MELTLSVLDPSSRPVSRLPYNEGILSSDYMLVSRSVFQQDADGVLITDGRECVQTDAGDFIKVPSPSLADLDRVLLSQYGIGPDSPFLAEARAALRYVYDEGWKLKYASLSARLLADISAMLGFQSMAYRDEWQYALKNHSHGYSTIRAFPSLTYDQVRAMYIDKSKCAGPRKIPEYLGTIETYQQSQDGAYAPVSADIYMPHIEFPSYPEPDIGEMRLLARNPPTVYTKNPKLTSVYSSDDMFYDSQYGGYWIYPKGQTVKCPAGDFQDACRVYGQNRLPTDTSFTVPLIKGFIKPFPGYDPKHTLRFVNWQNGLVSHSDHKIDNESFKSGSNTLFAEVTLPTTQNAGRAAVHSGSGKPASGHKVRLLSAEIKIQDIASQDTQTEYSSAELDRETRPRHQNPVCIVYIGRK